MVRSYTIYFVLFALTLQSGSFMFGWELRQWMYKHMVERMLQSPAFNQDLSIIAMTKDEFDRIKIHEREFRLNGQMYDVVYHEEHEGQMIFHCYRDSDEENLLVEFLGFLTEKFHPDPSKTANIPLSFAASNLLFIPLTQGFSITLTPQHRLYAECLSTLLSRPDVADIPPPRSCT